jgi:protease I
MAIGDKTVAILLAPRGNEEPEFVKPRDALRAAGAQVVVEDGA